MTEYWKKQMEHDLTKGYHDTLVDIIKLFKPKTVLEIGTGWGISGSAFMDNEVERLYTVDATTDDNYFKIAKDEIEQHRKPEQVVIYHRMKSGEYFDDHTEQFDMVFIDGDHGYKGCKEDLLGALKTVKPKGVIVMDDYLHKGNFIEGNECRVSQAVREVLIEQNIKASIHPHNKENGFLIIIK